MKLRTCGLPVIAGTALLALAASEPAAHAQRVTFTYKPPGSLVTWTVPATGLYQITYGAQGGNLIEGAVGIGGLGAEIGGDFQLTAGEVLQIAAGGAGSDSSGGSGSGGSVSIWLTTDDLTTALKPQTPVTFAPDSGSNPLTITINKNMTYQQMDGFGASITDSSAWLLADVLSPSQEQAVMTNLFDPVNGIGLSFLRQPIGASDLALGTIHLTICRPVRPIPI